jgi:RND family efflux transporter MFP subunit
MLAVQATAQPVTIVLEPEKEAVLRTTVNGRLAEISATIGQPVVAGQVIAQIDAQVQKARVDLARIVAEAEGGQKRAAKVVEQAISRLGLMERARERGAAQVWEVEAAEQNLAIAEADLLIAKEDEARKLGELELQRATLDEFSLRAPFDGTILDVMAEAGEVVETDTEVVLIGALSNLEATAFVPAEWVQDMSLGLLLTGTTDSGRDVPIVVKAVDPRIDPASATVRVVLVAANEDGRLQAGIRLSIEAP